MYLTLRWSTVARARVTSLGLFLSVYFIYLFIYLFIYVYVILLTYVWDVLPICMSVHYMCGVAREARSLRCSGTGVTDSCETPHRSWEYNPRSCGRAVSALNC